MSEKTKIVSEKDTRAKMLNLAETHYGKDGRKQLQMHFDKWDRLLKSCKNKQELDHMRKVACVEFYRLMGFADGLNLDGEDVIPAEKPVHN